MEGIHFQLEVQLACETPLKEIRVFLEIQLISAQSRRAAVTQLLKLNSFQFSTINKITVLHSFIQRFCFSWILSRNCSTLTAETRSQNIPLSCSFSYIRAHHLLTSFQACVILFWFPTQLVCSLTAGYFYSQQNVWKTVYHLFWLKALKLYLLQLEEILHKGSLNKERVKPSTVE